MNRKLLGVVLAAAFVLSSAASAGTFDPANSFLGIKIGNIPRIMLSANDGAVTLTDIPEPGTGHQILEDASIFQTTNYWVNSAAFTGFPQLTGLKITMHSGSGSFADGYSVPNSAGIGNIGGIGGQEDVNGTVLLVAGGFNILIPLDVIGSGGTTTISPVLNNAIVLEGEPFGTQKVTITGISSNIMYLPSNGTTGLAFTLNLTTSQILFSAVEVTLNGIVQEGTTAMVTGSNMLQSASKPGMVTLVSPFRLNTGNLAGKVPGAIYKKFSFVPEPGTMLLLVSGAVGLAVIGRKRLRK
jgi:hypothetical protein